MNWIPSIWDDDSVARLVMSVVLPLVVGIVCFLAGWWWGRRQRQAVGCSVFSAVLRHLQMQRTGLWLRHSREPRNRFQEALLEETREQIRERAYWKDHSSKSRLDRD